MLRPAHARFVSVALLLVVLGALIPPPGANALSVSINLTLDRISFHILRNESLNLTGNVTENPHGTPVAGARVRVGFESAQNLINETVTDVHGAFRVEVSIPFPPRESTLVVWAEDEAHNLSSTPVNVTVVTPPIGGPGFEAAAAGLALVAVGVPSALRARGRLKRR